MTAHRLIRRLATLGAATVLVAATTTLGGTATAYADPGNGANSGCGDYCANPGDPSGNGGGNGGNNGNAPCAGCVGNADNQNPPGQFKNGGDPNNGYECDGNNGIALGNPAHSGCTPPPSPQPTDTPTPPGGCTPTVANNNCGNPSSPPTPPSGCTPAAANNFCGTPPAVTPTVPAPVPPAIVPPDAPAPGVGGTVHHAPAPQAPQVLGKKITRVLGTKIVKQRTPAKAHVAASTIAALPHTGAPVGLLLEVGLTAIGLGILLSVAGRRRYLPRFAG